MTSHLSAEVAARHFLNVLRRRQKYHFHDRVLMEAARRLAEALGESWEPSRVPPTPDRAA